MSNRPNQEAPRSAGRPPLNKVVTRHNGLIFHAIAIASFLECATPLHANALNGVFRHDAGVLPWLENDWWGSKAARGRALRAYVEATWREFDWPCAYEEFYDVHRLRTAQGYARLGGRRSLLTLCALTAQTAAFYRGFALQIDDPELRAIVGGAAAAEGRAFDFLRALFERSARIETVGRVEAYRLVLRTAAQARDGAVQLAFSRLAPHWVDNPPFPELQYRDFVRRTASQLRRALAPGILERLLFGPWFRAPRALVPYRLPAREDVAATLVPRLAMAA